MPVRSIRRRYLGFGIVSEGRFTSEEIADVVQKAALKLYGVQGLSRISPTLIEFNEENQTGIIRCSHKYVRMMRASLAFTTEIGDQAASILVRSVSGTIKSLRQRKEQVVKKY